MIDKNKREVLAEITPDAVIFDNPSFDKSIVAISEEGGAVYDYDRMVEELMTDENMSYEDAAEFIDYNTLRVLPYAAKDGTPPTIIYTQFF